MTPIVLKKMFEYFRCKRESSSREPTIAYVDIPYSTHHHRNKKPSHIKPIPHTFTNVEDTESQAG